MNKPHSRAALAVIFVAATLLVLSPRAASAQIFSLSTISALETFVVARRPPTLERRAFELINQVRLDHGLKPVTWSDQVAAVARLHSDDMAEHNYFSHTDAAGRFAGARADSMGLSDWRKIGENIAWNCGYDDPVARAVQAWMNSPSHRYNILRKKWKETGIGIAVTADGRYFFTQVFLKRR